MPDASCGKEGGEAFEADDNGVIVRDDMPTGKYNLVCQAPRYHVRTVPFELGLQEAQTKSVQLVRLGGDDWYPEHPDRQVKIQILRRQPQVSRAHRLPGRAQGRFRAVHLPMDLEQLPQPLLLHPRLLPVHGQERRSVPGAAHESQCQLPAERGYRTLPGPVHQTPC